jgi:shikimate kinase
MPKSGKTTPGKKAADALGMQFYDTDKFTAERLRSGKREPLFPPRPYEFTAAEEAKEILARGLPDPARPHLRDADELMVQLYRDTVPNYERLADFTVENNDGEEAGLEKLVKMTLPALKGGVSSFARNFIRLPGLNPAIVFGFEDSPCRAGYATRLRIIRAEG